MGSTKRLVLIDDDALSAAQSALGTSTIKDTIDIALRRVTEGEEERIRERLAVLASLDPADRTSAWER